MSMRKISSRKHRGKGEWGYVYVLANPSMPGIVKIGMTTRSPRQRAKELSASTGVPSPFVITFSRRVWNPRRVEALTHQALAIKRLNRRREFFKTTTDSAKKNIVKFSKSDKKPTGLRKFALFALFAAGLGCCAWLLSLLDLYEIKGFIYKIPYFLQYF